MALKFLTIVLVSLLTLLHAESSFGTIATGSKNGTYIQLGDDISKLLAKYKATLNVQSSKGSIDNLDTLVGKSSVSKASFAIVQSDAMKYYRFIHFQDTKEDVKKKVKTLLPLYNEYLHIFTKKGTNIQFKRGGFLKVGVLSKKSGAAISAHLIENAYGTRFQYVYATFKEAKQYLQDGTIDIYIDVIAMPSTKYKDLQNLDLVELPKNPTLEKSYIATHFTQVTYSWLLKNTRTYKVPSILVTNLVDPKNNKAVEIFLKVILKNYPYLLKNGHPKWKEAYHNRRYKAENLHPVAQRLLSRL